MSEEHQTIDTQTNLHRHIGTFLSPNFDLYLGGSGGFHGEQSITLDTSFHGIKTPEEAPIDSIKFTEIHGPHGLIPIPVLYPSSGK
jgi:hypothetical protein